MLYLYLSKHNYIHVHVYLCDKHSTATTQSQVNMLFDKTSLSPYIRFGCLSVRFFLYEVKKLASKDSAMEPLLKDVTGKLLQREFYFTVAKQVRKCLPAFLSNTHCTLYSCTSSYTCAVQWFANPMCSVNLPWCKPLYIVPRVLCAVHVTNSAWISYGLCSSHLNMMAIQHKLSRQTHDGDMEGKFRWKWHTM